MPPRPPAGRRRYKFNDYNVQERRQNVRSGAARHAQNLGIGSTAVPKAQQDQVGGLQNYVIRPLAAVIENMFIEQHVQAGHGDTEEQGGFDLVVGILENPVGLFQCRLIRGLHAHSLPGAIGLYLLWRERHIR